MNKIDLWEEKQALYVYRATEKYKARLTFANVPFYKE